jgi:hypothetical protein
MHRPPESKNANGYCNHGLNGLTCPVGVARTPSAAHFARRPCAGPDLLLRSRPGVGSYVDNASYVANAVRGTARRRPEMNARRIANLISAGNGNASMRC